jgi:NAD(P)-dependent dehydrogenase (short-subunit alcohol dehydrogenase family)
MTDVAGFSPDLLKGRVALVTGATAGIGRHFAKTLARAGAQVVLTGRRAERLEELAQEITGEGGTAAGVPLDIRDAAAVAKAVDFAESRFGLVDILVNNAGAPDANWATKLSLETIDTVIDTNFRGPFLLMTEVARRLIKAKQPGRIVNVSSSSTYTFAPTTASALYSATKAGINRMTETLAIEWAHYGINVNAIAPGMIRSEMTDGYIERVGDEVKATWPRKRFGEPEFMDSTLLYLLAPASHFVTGAVVIVDDAQSIR